MRDITLAWNMDNTQLNQSYILWQQINNSIINIDKKLQSIQTTGFDNSSLNEYIKKINTLNQSIEQLFSSLKGMVKIKPDFNPLIAKISELKDLLTSLNKAINAINNKDINIQAKNINNVISRLESLDKAMKNMNNKLNINIDTQNAIQNVKELNKELLKAKKLFDQVNQQRTQRQPSQPSQPSTRTPSSGASGRIPSGAGGGMGGGMPGGMGNMASGMGNMGGMGGMGGALSKLGPYAAVAGKALGMVTDAVKGAYDAVLGLDDLIEDFSNNKIVKAVSVYEKYEAALYTLSGSHIQARNTLANLQQFAKSTPFEFEEITQTYIKLANRGVNVNDDLLTSLGDIASAQGKKMDQMTEAFLDGQMGQYRRFIEFGIKVSKEGEKTVLKMGSKVGKGKDMEEAIKNLAKQQGVIGGMANQSVSLGGQISNVTDSISIMFTKIGQIPLVRKGFEMFLSVIDAVATSIGKIATKMNVAMGPFKDSLFDQEAVTGEFDLFFYNLTESQQQSMRGIAKNLKLSLDDMAYAMTQANDGQFEAMKKAGIQMTQEGDKIIAKMGKREVIAESAEDAVEKLARFTYGIEELSDKNQLLWNKFDMDVQRGLNSISSNANININALTEATSAAYAGTEESYKKLRALGIKITNEQGATIVEYNGKIAKGINVDRAMAGLGDAVKGMSDLSEQAKFLGVNWSEVWNDMLNFDYKGLWENIVHWDWIKDIDFDWSWIWETIESLSLWILQEAIPWILGLIWDLIKFIFVGLGVLLYKAVEQAILGIYYYIVYLLKKLYLEFKVFLDPLIGIFKEIYTKIVAFFSGLYNILKTTFLKIYNAITGTGKGIYDTIVGFFTKIYNKVASIFMDIWNVIKKVIFFIKETIDSYHKFMIGVFVSIYEFIRDRLKAIADVYISIFKFLYSFIEPVVEFIKNLFSSLYDSIIGFVNPIIDKFKKWLLSFEWIRIAIDGIKKAWDYTVKGIKDGIDYIVSLYERLKKYLPELMGDVQEVSKRHFMSTREMMEADKKKAEVKKRPTPVFKKCPEGFVNDGNNNCIPVAPGEKKKKEDDEAEGKKAKLTYEPIDLEKLRDLNKWSDAVYSLAKADEELRKASIELQNKRADEKAKPDEIKKLEQSLIEKQWQKENIIRDDIRKRNEERDKIAMNMSFNVRKQNLEKLAVIEKWSKEKLDNEKTQMEVDRLQQELELKKKYHAVDIYEIEDTEAKIKEKKDELRQKQFLEEIKKEEEFQNLANEQTKKVALENIEMQVNSQLISKEDGEVRKLKIEMDAHEKAMQIKEQFNHIEFIEDQKYANERLEYIGKLYKAELELLIANENKKLETITDLTNRKIKAMETEFDRLMQVQERYATLTQQASEISDLIKANLELSKNDQLFNERLNEYIEKRTQINNDLLKAQANKDKNAISIFTNKLKELSTAFENTEEQYYNAANQITNKITDMGIDFFNTTNKNIKAINDEFVKQSQTSIKELGKLDSQLADVYKKGVDLTNTGHKVVLEGINQISETMGTMMASIDEYNKKLNELGVEYDRLSENERLHAENAVEAQKKIYEWERKRGALQAMLNSTGLDVDGMRQVQDEINRLDLSIFNKKQQLQSEENAVSIAKRSKEVIEKQINSVNFDKFKTQLQSTIKGLEEIFDSIEQKRLENVDKMIDKHKAEMEAIKEKAAEEQKLLDMEMQRQNIINKLAEQRIKELQDLSKTVPAAQKERIEKEMEEERKKIKDLNKEKDKAKKLEEKRLKDEQEKIKKLEEEKRAIQHEQFEISRVAQTVQVVMNTAEAISKAYAQGGIFATIFVPVIVAMGAIQAATIMGQPNPYHEGTLAVPGQGDKDTVPAILTPGEAVIPKHTNLLYRDSIESIFNHKISPTILNDFVKNYRIKKVDMNGGIMINQNNMSNIDIERLIKAIENKKMVSVTIDNEGINTYINHVNTKTKILDKKLHRKI